MSASKACGHVHPDGRPCAAKPMAKGGFCFWHSPDTSAEVEEARRLGGFRRKRERTLASAYDVSGLTTSTDVLRVLQIALFDALGLENSVARDRLLIAIAAEATRVHAAEREEALAASFLDEVEDE